MSIENDDIMADIKQAMEPVDEPETIETVEDPEETAEEKTERARDEQGKFAKKEEKPEVEALVIDDPAQQAVSKIEPPVSLPANVKAKWDKLDPDVQQYWANREADIHKNMTAQDGDLRIGRDFKEVLTPYAPMFQHMNIAPKELVSDLMQKMHVLNTGSPDQKLNLLHNIAKQFQIDINATPEPVNPHIQNLERQVQQLSQLANPEVIEKRLQDKILADKVTSEVEAFKSDPANVHFEQVKTLMGSLLSSGAAKDMKDAYDQACYANPTIRSTMLQANAAQEAEKRKAELAKKRTAGASVNGSPSGTSPAPKAPTNSIEDDIMAAMNELSDAI